MDHSLPFRSNPFKEKMPPSGGIFAQCLFACLPAFVFTLLVRDAAAGLAGGLARGLAFTAAAVFGALAESAGGQSSNVLHKELPPLIFAFGLL